MQVALGNVEAVQLGALGEGDRVHVVQGTVVDQHQADGIPAERLGHHILHLAAYQRNLGQCRLEHILRQVRDLYVSEPYLKLN